LDEAAETEAVHVKAAASDMNSGEDGSWHVRPTGPYQILEGWQLAYKTGKGQPSFGMIWHAALLHAFHGNFGGAAEIVHVKIMAYIPVVPVLVVVVLCFVVLCLQASIPSFLPQDLEPAHVAMAAIRLEHLGPSPQAALQLI
jgi:hypothetical protein